jgi:hypothetical protein
MYDADGLGYQVDSGSVTACPLVGAGIDMEPEGWTPDPSEFG